MIRESDGRQVAAHIPALDGLRAFSALSVCLFHFVCTTTGFITDQRVLTAFSVGQNGVKTFFVISGFVVPWSLYRGDYSLRQFGRFFLKRLARLEPPYIASLAVAVAFMLLRARLYDPNTDHVSVTQVALHFGYLIPFASKYHWLNGVYWTLAIEFQYYAMIGLTFPRILRAPLPARIAMSAAAIGLSFTTSSAFFPFWLPLFWMGVTVFLRKTRQISSTEAILTLGILHVFSAYRFGLSPAVYAAIAVAVILFGPNLRFRGMQTIGEMSYSLYLFHPLIGATFINVMSHRVNSTLGKATVITAGVFVALISAMIMYRLVERPAKRLSQSIRYEQRSLVEDLAVPQADAAVT